MFVYVCNRRFEQNAFGLLDDLYKIDQEKSYELLERPLKTWKNTTVFELADKANLMDFMQHGCCQTKLDKIWHGKLSTRTKMWQVALLYISYTASFYVTSFIFTIIVFVVLCARLLVYL